MVMTLAKTKASSRKRNSTTPKPPAILAFIPMFLNHCMLHLPCA
jgi:hypothetical protein